MDFINYTFDHPDIQPFLNDDLSIGQRTDPKPILNLKNNLALFLIPECDGEKIGFFFFHQWNSICYEVHSAILPEYRGSISIEAAIKAKDWMFSNTVCMKIVTHVPFFNRRAYALIVRMGGKVEGVNERSFLNKGILYDQYIFGIKKEGEICQQQFL